MTLVVLVTGEHSLLAGLVIRFSVQETLVTLDTENFMYSKLACTSSFPIIPYLFFNSDFAIVYIRLMIWWD